MGLLIYGSGSGGGGGGSPYGGALNPSGQLAFSPSGQGGQSYVSTSNSATLNPANALSISAWVQTWPSLVATNGLGIVSRGDGTATGAWGNQPYFMIISAGPPLIVNCGLNAAGAAIGVVAAAPIPAGGWHHILMAYDKVNLKVYVDNVLRVTTAFSTSITSSAVLTYIGTWYSLVATRCFFGRIFDVRIWNSTLLQADCTGLYSSGLSGSNLVTPIQPGSLVGWWKLNDFTPGQTGAVPTTAADSSGNGFTGTLAGTDKPMWLAGSNLLF